jgi:hypothetical protein
MHAYQNALIEEAATEFRIEKLAHYIRGGKEKPKPPAILKNR